MKRTFITLLVVALLAGGLFAILQYRARAQDQAANAYETTQAERGSLTATVGGTGLVRANQSAILAWQTSGLVEQVNVAIGDQVIADQVLATLQTTSLLQNVILAQAELTDAQKALDDLVQNAETARANALQAIATYAQQVRDAQYQLDNFTVPSNQQNLTAIEALDLMNTRLDQARAAFEPYKFAPSGDSTRQDLKEKLDEAQSDYNAAVRRLEYEYKLEVASANLDKARQDYEKWKDGPDPNDVAAAETRIAAAQATMNLARVSAPFAGMLTDVQAKPGDQVSPGTPAFRLDDLTHLLVDVQISEVDINRIQAGQDVYLTFDAILSKEYHGMVTQVAQVGTDNQGVVDFTVTAELTDADDAVKPGMTAAVNIVVEQLEDILLVPNRAVRVLDGERVVYVLRNGNLEAVTISLGSSSDTVSQVLEGDLQPGDAIVLNPPTSFEQNGPPPWMQR
ncbi:MAG: efflux RND transporter periplasmic adaptor subunit [Anaerolineales bacterium]|nr:efflux RND transporter periplasmic adaptor subunit [Anaerolineales bacterium]